MEGLFDAPAYIVRLGLNYSVAQGHRMPVVIVTSDHASCAFEAVQEAIKRVKKILQYNDVIISSEVQIDTPENRAAWVTSEQNKYESNTGKRVEKSTEREFPWYQI